METFHSAKHKERIKTSVFSYPPNQKGFMQRPNLLVVVILLQLVVACGDGGTRAPTGPPAPPSNRAPTVSAAIPDQSVEEGEQVAVGVSGAYSDPDGDALSYEAASDAPGVATASVSGSDVTLTGEAPGTATVAVAATDPGDLSATQTFEVTVSSSNHAPTVSDAVPDQSVEEGAQVVVDVSGAFSDPDGDALSYEAASDAQGVATASVSGSDVTLTGQATITLTGQGDCDRHGRRNRSPRPQRHPDLQGRGQQCQPCTNSVGCDSGPDSGRGSGGDGGHLPGLFRSRWGRLEL